MRISKNFLKSKIVFRCDAGNNPHVGTGHLYRCLNIADHLSKKYKLKKKQIVFICKDKGEFKISKKILNSREYLTRKINNKVIDNSLKETDVISKASGNLLIIDRIGKTNSSFYNRLKNKFNKIIIFEDKSRIRNKFDLSINSLVFTRFYLRSKNVKIGFKFMLLPLVSKKISSKSLTNNIFLSFGGYDHNNLCVKVLNNIKKIDENLNIFVPKIYKQSFSKVNKKHKIILYNRNEYIKYFSKCNIAIISGGLTLYDGILLKKKIICVPQYRHQSINTNKIKKVFPIFVIKKSVKSFDSKIISKFNEIYDNKKLEKIIKSNKNNIFSKKNYIKTMRYIEKIYEKSLN